MDEMTLIHNYPHYSITNTGKIYSWTRGRYLRQEVSKNGYARVVLSKNGVGTKFLVHRLVAQHYLEIPNTYKPFVNHKDSDRLNNNYENLEWCTAKENTQHMISKGRHVSAKVRKKLTHCQRGHEFTPENTYVKRNGDRNCRTCKQDRERLAWHRRQRERNAS